MTAADMSMVPAESAGIYQLIAASKDELRSAHEKMVEWAVRMQQSCEAELEESGNALEVAERNGWEPLGTLKNRMRMLSARKVFYSKVEAALRAGYVVVPNFAMTVFAIRTNAKRPRGNAVSRDSWPPNMSFEQRPQLLPQGDGEYKSNRPTVATDVDTVESGSSKVTRYTEYPVELTGIDFPIALAKPELMNETARAMAPKLFDEIGVAVDTERGWASRGDPIILARIRNPRRNAPNMTFFVAWYFETERI